MYWNYLQLFTYQVFAASLGTGVCIQGPLLLDCCYVLNLFPDRGFVNVLFITLVFAFSFVFICLPCPLSPLWLD